METVKTYLTQWGLSHLISKFEEQGVDDVAFKTIDVEASDFKELIEKYGDRLKFKANYLKTFSQSVTIIDFNNVDNQVSEGNQSDKSEIDENQETDFLNLSTSTSIITEEYVIDNNLPLDTVPVPHKKDNSFLGTPRDVEYTYNLDLKLFLAQSVTGRQILAQRDNFTPEIRDNLVALLIDHDLQQDINAYIPTKRFLQLARLIKQEFPKENIATYYTPYVRRDNKIIQCMKGKLVNRYHNQRKKLKRSGLFNPSPTTSSNSSDIEIAESEDRIDDINDFCAWLKYNVEPWPEVISKWKATAPVRLNNYKNNTDITIQDYFNEYKVLKQPLAYQLFEIDFEYLYFGKSRNFFIQIHEKKAKLLELLEKKDILNKFLPQINKENLSEDGKALLALLATPYLFQPLVVTTNKKKWKPSRLEVAASFMIHVKNSAELQVSIEHRNKKLSDLHLQCQPVVILVGELDNVKGYVSVDNNLYALEPALKSVDVCFKLIHATFAKYPDESCHVWQFIQLYIYDLKTQWDKNYCSVSSIISDLS